MLQDIQLHPLTWIESFAIVVPVAAVSQFAVSQTTCAHVGFVPHVNELSSPHDKNIKRYFVKDRLLILQLLSQLYTHTLYWHKGKQSGGNPHCWLAWPRLNWTSLCVLVCWTNTGPHFTNIKIRSLVARFTKKKNITINRMTASNQNY